MNDTLKEKIRKSAEGYYRDTLSLPDWKRRSEGRTERKYEQYMFERLTKLAGPLEEKAVLDLGCGWGGVVVAVAEPASNSVGVEPDEERLEIAQELLKETQSGKARVLRGVGEQLPFPDNSFDVVVSYQVLEHVKDPAKVIAEVRRVLKPGGVFHFSTPNYMAFYEPHYKIFWLPLLPKPLGRFYLWLRGRKPSFLGHINYMTPLNVHRYLRREKFQFVDLHHQQAATKLRAKLDGWFARAPGWKGLAKAVHSMSARLLFCVHTCFLNQDQEYLATKA